MVAKLSQMEYWLNDESVNLSCIIEDGNYTYSYVATIKIHIPEVDLNIMNPIVLTREGLEKRMNLYDPNSKIYQRLKTINNIGTSFLYMKEIARKK